MYAHVQKSVLLWIGVLGVQASHEPPSATPFRIFGLGCALRIRSDSTGLFLVLPPAETERPFVLGTLTRDPAVDLLGIPAQAAADADGVRDPDTTLPAPEGVPDGSLGNGQGFGEGIDRDQPFHGGSPCMSGIAIHDKDGGYRDHA